MMTQNEIVELVKAWKNVKEAFRELAGELEKAFSNMVKTYSEMLKLEDVIEETSYQDEIQRLRSKWIVPKDTRRPSQNINNKPRFMVRKVIR